MNFDHIFHIGVAVCAIITIVACIIVLATDSNPQDDWINTRQVITIKVQPGDTVDGYWAEYAPDWMSRGQFRAEFKSLNNVQNCYLIAGTKVKIYVEGER